MSEHSTTCIASVQASHILDHVLGTEYVVRCRRLNMPVKGENHHGTLQHLLGSRSEGFDIPGSDVDIMHVPMTFSFCEFYGSPRKLQQDCPFRVRFILNSTGYVYLTINPECIYVKEFMKSAIFQYMLESCIYDHKRLIIPSLIFLRRMNHYGHTVTGPSIENLIDIPVCDSDNVYALGCKTWPTIANEWIHRNRKYSWPCSSVVSLIKSNGCHLVPIGEYNSPIKDLQWRVSFVVSEQLLVRSFNHIQFKVYGVLKLTKSQVFCRYDNSITHQKLITSFHLKTIMFWILENTPNEIWIPQRFIYCLRLCLVYLGHFIKTKFLPNYFLPKDNIFRKHAYTNTKNLITNIDVFINNPCVLLTSLALLHDTIRLFFNSHDTLARGSTDFQIFSLLKSRGTFFQLFLCPSRRPFTETMALIKTRNNTDVTSNEYTYMLFYCKLVESMFASSGLMVQNQITKTNIIAYMEIRKFKHFGLRQTQFDLSGWLKLATYFYCIEQYENASYLCRRFTECFTPYVMDCGIITGKTNKDLFMSRIYDGLQLYEELKCLTASHVVLEYRNGMFPKELSIEVEISTPYCRIRPLPYAYFLLFETAYHQHQSQELLTTFLSTLESFLNDEHYNKFRRDETLVVILNMVGICYEHINEIDKAVFYYRKCVRYTCTYYPSVIQKAAQIRLNHLMRNNTF